MSDVLSVSRSPDHLHVYEGVASPMSEKTVLTLYCYSDDCYAGLDRVLYPPKLIGPKLKVSP